MLFWQRESQWYSSCMPGNMLSDINCASVMKLFVELVTLIVTLQQVVVYPLLTQLVPSELLY